MNRSIANYLKGLIAERHYAHVVAGVVTPVNVQRGGKVVTYAVDCGVIGADCPETDMKVLAPDSSRRSIFYFEDTTPPEVVGIEGQFTNMRCVLTLVGWLNLQKLGLSADDGCSGCSWSYRVYNDILSQLPVNRFNIEGDCALSNVQVAFRRQLPRTAEVFQRYTFGQEYKQFRILPYDFFAIELLCTWRVNTRCVGTVPENEPFSCWPPPSS